MQITAKKESWDMTQEEYRNQDQALIRAAQRLHVAYLAIGGDRWGESRRFAGRSAGVRIDRKDKALKSWRKTWDKADACHRKLVEKAAKKGLIGAGIHSYPDLVARYISDRHTPSLTLAPAEKRGNT